VLLTVFFSLGQGFPYEVTSLRDSFFAFSLDRSAVPAVSTEIVFRRVAENKPRFFFPHRVLALLLRELVLFPVVRSRLDYLGLSFGLLVSFDYPPIGCRLGPPSILDTRLVVVPLFSFGPWCLPLFWTSTVDSSGFDLVCLISSDVLCFLSFP